MIIEVCALAYVFMQIQFLYIYVVKKIYHYKIS